MRRQLKRNLVHPCRMRALLLNHKNQRLLLWTWINLKDESYYHRHQTACTTSLYQRRKHYCNDPCCSLRWVCQVLHKAQSYYLYNAFLVLVFKLEIVPSHR